MIYEKIAREERALKFFEAKAKRAKRHQKIAFMRKDSIAALEIKEKIDAYNLAIELISNELFNDQIYRSNLED